MADASTSLELSSEAFQTLVAKAAKAITQHLESIDRRPVWRPVSETVDGSARASLPATAAPFDGLMDELFDRVLDSGLQTRSPGYLAYMPTGGVLASAVADLIAVSVNRYVGNWAAAPGLVELEATVVRWFAEILGYPASSQGFLASGGSMANFSAILCARHRLGAVVPGARAYGSSSTHHSLQKALMMAGFADDTYCEVESNARGELSVAALRAQMRADRAAGRKPFLILATAGTTICGSIDPIDALADLAAEEDVWLHVDAAYGGFFMMTEHGKTVMKGIDRADSVTLDPHKSLFIPYGTGALLVRNGNELRGAHRGTGQRYSPRQADDDRIDFCEYSPELSRSCRGLRVWLPSKCMGRRPLPLVCRRSWTWHNGPRRPWRRSLRSRSRIRRCSRWWRSGLPPRDGRPTSRMSSIAVCWRTSTGRDAFTSWVFTFAVGSI